MIGQQSTLEHKFIAGIDIGTNTILMSIAKISENGIEIIEDYHSIARLGEGVDKTGIINDNAIERATGILKNYKKIIDNFQEIVVIANGTSALRDAKNREEVIKILSYIIGAQLIAISGEKEAELSYLGAIDNNNKCLMIDIGGGSTEITIGENNKIIDRISFNFGSVRLTEKFFSQHPPSNDEIQKAENFILELIGKNEFPIIENIYGIAGTVTTIASIVYSAYEFKKENIHNKIITKIDIEKVFEKLLNCSLTEISEKYGVNPKRADVITAGVLILKTIINKFQFNELIVSANGLRTGIIKNYLNDLYKN